MKYLKLFESFENIDSICKKYGIENYTINDDGSIDVDGGVDLDKGKLTKLPLRFRNVGGYFDCDYNGLTTLEGSPISVGSRISCTNNKLTSLEGCPESIGGYFNCESNYIRTFEGFPRNLVGKFCCKGNPVWLLWILFRDKDKIELFNDFGITDGEVVILERLNEFLEMIGREKVTDTSDIEEEGYKII